ncbi:Rop guanine nucleotide exchange factor 12 [Tanacetum coccineum]
MLRGGAMSFAFNINSPGGYPCIVRILAAVVKGYNCKLAALSDAADYFIATVDGLGNKVFEFKDRAWELVSFQALDAGVMLNKDHGNHPNETSRADYDSRYRMGPRTVGNVCRREVQVEDTTVLKKVDMIKEQFSKLLLEEDMSGGGQRSLYSLSNLKRDHNCICNNSYIYHSILRRQVDLLA